MNINGISRVLTESTEGFFYATDKMFKDNILIEERNVDDEQKLFRTELNLYYFDDLDAKSFQLEYDIPSGGVFVYSVVKEIVELYNTNSLNDFLEIIHELSSGSMCASYQSREESKIEIRTWIESYFDEFKRVSKIQ